MHQRPFTAFSRLLIAAALLAVGTPRTWGAPSCTDLCSAMASLQSYGTGDPACLAACQGQASACKSLWDTYFLCVGSSSSPEACWQDFSDARECSVCQLGEVDLEGLEAAVFVNNQNYVNGQLVCSDKVDQGGTVGLPYCDFSLGLEMAIERQKDKNSTKVVVCPGTYRESHDDPATPLAGPTSSSAEVIVESVVRDRAVITGSEDWTGAWLPVQLPVQEIYRNEFLRSIDPADPGVWLYPHLHHLTTGTFPQPPTSDPGQVRRFAADTALAEHVLAQAVAPFGAHRATVSIYLHPNGVDRFRLELLHDGDGNPSTADYSSGAWYDFELPPGGPCGFERSSRDGVRHIEDLGTGWYRVSLTETFDTDPGPQTGFPPLLAGARLTLIDPQGELVWAGDGQAGVFVFGPQLDHRPLDEFRTEARSYVPTDTATEASPVTVTKTLYVNDPAVKTWLHDWGLARHNGWGELHPIVRRSEMVFINGDKLRQELSFADLRPGSFLVDDGISYAQTNYVEHPGMIGSICTEAQPCSIYIDPPPGANMLTDPVEVARSPRLLWMNPVRHWQFRGFLFRHSAGAYDKDKGGEALEARLNSAVSFHNAAELTLLENRFEWNSAFGLSVGGTVVRTLSVSEDSNNRLIRNTVSHNGIGGLYLGGCQRCEVVEDEYSHNNWSGAQGGFMGHTTAGAKVSANIDTVIRGLSARQNFAHGLWLDYENQQVQVLDGTFANNLGNGVYFEANDEWCSPVADTTNYVSGCSIVGNEIGVRLIGSRGTRLSLNQLANNRVALSLIGDPVLPHDATCYPSAPATTPPKWLRDLYFDHNAVTATCPGDLWIHYGDNAGNYSLWQPVMQTLFSGWNTYSHVEGLGTPAIRLLNEFLTVTDWKSCDPTLPSPPSWCFAPQGEGTTEQ